MIQTSAIEKSNYIGQIYAHALLGLAKDSDVVDAIKSDLDFVLATAEQEKDFMRFMVSPYFPTAQKKDVAAKMFWGRLNELTVNFVMVIIKNGRMKYLSSIINRYHCLWEEYHGYYPINVTVSQQLNPSEVKKLSGDIAAALDRKVRLDVNVDSSVLGGIIIRYGEHHIDNTVRTRLINMVRTITNRIKRREEN